MAVFGYIQNMYDVRLKPRLLRSVITDKLPDEKHPFPSPSQLSKVVSVIKTHELLSESFREPVDRKLSDIWKSAVDAWIERLLLLILSNMPDKCWAGICLLGLTCQECSADRFLSSYSAWFQKLFSKLQPPSDSQFVKVASCASLSDLFVRLSGFPSAKKDGTSQSGKLVQPILKLLIEDGSEAVWEGALDLLGTLINFFPSSVHRHYDNVEATIVSKIMSGKCSTNMSKKFAHCLALLPRTRGDEESWSLMMQKILISINVHITDAFQDLEDETKSSEIMRLLVPPGKDPPPPLGGQLSCETLDRAALKSEELLLSRVSMLMLCSCRMLGNSFPVQVTVPVRPLLTLVRRVLLADGSLSQPSMPLATVTQQEFICSELPVLHSYSLDILTAIIKGIRSQLLPHAADVVRLLTEYFRRCSLPELRIKVYSIIQILLISMGVGMTLYLAQEVINNAFADLDSVSMGICVASPHTFSKPIGYAFQQLNDRKRKHASTIVPTLENQNDVGLGVELPKPKPAAPLSVQIAALRTLETLLTVGGALSSECWRPNVDRLLITIATNACEGGWANEEKGASITSGQPTSTWADFQLAALHALLASFLSPARVRPPYLSQGLDIFRRGRQETGTKLAEFCAHALLALEVLIHPRALPLYDFPASNRSLFDEGLNRRIPENIFSNAQRPSVPFSKGILEMNGPDPDDDLYDSWLGNGEDVEAPVSNTDERMEIANEHSEKHAQQTVESHLVEKPTVNGTISAEFLEEANRDPISSVNVEEERSSRDESMIDIKRSQVSIDSTCEVGTSDKRSIMPTNTMREGEIEPIKAVDEGDLIPCSNHASRTGESVIPPSSLLTNNNLASEKDTTVTTISDDAQAQNEGLFVTVDSVLSKGKEIIIDDDSDMDSFPDIIVGDPDSD